MQYVYIKFMKTICFLGLLLFLTKPLIGQDSSSRFCLGFGVGTSYLSMREINSTLSSYKEGHFLNFSTLFDIHLLYSVKRFFFMMNSNSGSNNSNLNNFNTSFSFNNLSFLFGYNIIDGKRTKNILTSYVGLGFNRLDFSQDIKLSGNISFKEKNDSLPLSNFDIRSNIYSILCGASFKNKPLPNRKIVFGFKVGVNILIGSRLWTNSNNLVISGFPVSSNFMLFGNFFADFNL